MTRVPPLAVVALLVGALAAPVAGAGLAVDPQPVLEGTPRVLPAGPSPAAGFGTVQASVGPALSADTASLDSQLQTLLADERLAAADGTAERYRVARAVIERIADRLDTLRAAERRAYRGHANGTLSEHQLLVRLARVQAGVAPLNATLDRVGSATGDGRPSSLERRQATISAEYRTLLGPVRSRALAAFHGSQRPTRVFVRSSDVGVVLSTLDGGTYYREAFRADNRDIDVTSEFESQLELVSALNEFYPWIAAGHTRGYDARNAGIGTSGIHSVTRFHDQGRLRVAIDGSTREVFREIHRLDIGQMPTRVPVNASSGSVRVAVAQTYDGGPMRVLVATGGAPVEGVPVLVNGTRVGQTDAEGELWTLAPAGEFTVTADAETDVTVRVGG